MIALFGGSFDPVHFGHIHNADLVYKYAKIEKFIILPCGIPAHKDTLLFSPEQRLEFLQIALKDYQHLEIDDFEFNNQTNYTIDTLKHFSAKYKYLNFIMGSDSFLDLATWDGYLEFKNLTNIIVINRNDKISNFYNFELAQNIAELKNNLGKVYLIQNDFIDISSTKVREKIKQKQDLTPYIPQTIINKINEYTR
jgi:nicotinate-nucleotide adenylyltransferase